MFYVLFFHKKGESAGQRSFAGFQSEKSLIEYLAVKVIKEDAIEVNAILETAKEYDLRHTLTLEPGAPVEEKVIPEGLTCNECGRGLRANNKSGVCTPCQVKPKGKKKKQKK